MCCFSKHHEALKFKAGTTVFPYKKSTTEKHVLTHWIQMCFFPTPTYKNNPTFTTHGVTQIKGIHVRMKLAISIHINACLQTQAGQRNGNEDTEKTT